MSAGAVMYVTCAGGLRHACLGLTTHCQHHVYARAGHGALRMTAVPGYDTRLAA